MDNSSKRDATIFGGDFIGDAVGSVAGAAIGNKYFPHFKTRIPLIDSHVGSELVGGHIGGTLGAVGGFIAGKTVANKLFPHEQTAEIMSKAAQEQRDFMLKQAEILEKVASYIEELEAIKDIHDPKSQEITKMAQKIGLNEREAEYLRSVPETVLQKLAQVERDSYTNTLGVGVGPRVDKMDPITEFILSDM